MSSRNSNNILKEVNQGGIIIVLMFILPYSLGIFFHEELGNSPISYFFMLITMIMIVRLII